MVSLPEVPPGKCHWIFVFSLSHPVHQLFGSSFCLSRRSSR